LDSETGKNVAGDRRRHPRFADDAQVLCVADEATGGFHPARLTEISIDGMRLVADRPFEAGSQLYTGVFLEEAQEPLVMLGVVQHCDRGPAGATLGVEFLSVTEDQRLALAKLGDYLKRRHGASATVVTVHPAPAIRRIGEERWW